MFLFLNEACFGQLALQLAENFLLAQTLPPEFDQCIHLLLAGHYFYTLVALTIELVDEHLNEASYVLEAA